MQIFSTSYFRDKKVCIINQQKFEEHLKIRIDVTFSKI